MGDILIYDCIEKGDYTVKINFSRHARRRGKLYEISEETIRLILKEKELTQGNHEIIADNVSGFNFPIKVIINVKNDTITVVTNYPLKKGVK